MEKNNNFTNIAIQAAFILIIPLITVIYGLVNHTNGAVHSLVTDLDRQIPFVKEFILPYISWYFFIFIGFLLLFLKDKKSFYKTIIIYSLSVLICYGIFLVYQTTVPRPVIGPSKDIFTRLVLLIYRIDNPYNCFPSIHVLVCYLLSKAVNNSSIEKSWVKYAVSLWAFMIIISTLFVKQHVLMDVFAGLILGHLMYRLLDTALNPVVLKIVKKTSSSSNPNENLLINN